MFSTVEELGAIEAIRQLMARRLRAMDTKDWELYGTVHTEDVIVESFEDHPDGAKPNAGGVSGRVVGRENVTEVIRSLMDDPVPMTSVHHVHSSEIGFKSPDSASGIWALEDRLWWQNGDTRESLHGFGHYHEEYRRESGIWKISRRRLARYAVTSTPNFFVRIQRAAEEKRR